MATSPYWTSETVDGLTVRGAAWVFCRIVDAPNGGAGCFVGIANNDAPALHLDGTALDNVTGPGGINAALQFGGGTQVCAALPLVDGRTLYVNAMQAGRIEADPVAPSSRCYVSTTEGELDPAWHVALSVDDAVTVLVASLNPLPP